MNALHRARELSAYAASVLRRDIAPWPDVIARGGGGWLGGRDSNPDTVVQSHVSYRWTTSQLEWSPSEARKGAPNRRAGNTKYI